MRQKTDTQNKPTTEFFKTTTQQQQTATTVFHSSDEEITTSYHLPGSQIRRSQPLHNTTNQMAPLYSKLCARVVLLQTLIVRNYAFMACQKSNEFGTSHLIRYDVTRVHSSKGGTNNESLLHSVNGVDCREVGIDVKHLGIIKILEATASAQDELVEMACATEEEITESDGKQLIKSGDPYGAVLWPAASAVSNHLLTKVIKENPSKSLEGLTILELGTGTGLCALAAALGGASKVIATDYEQVPLNLLEFAAKNINNSGLNIEESEDRGVRLARIQTKLFDICDHDTPLPEADIVIAADIMYEPMTGIAAAIRTVEALKAGARVIIGCSPGRPGRPHYTSKLKELLPNMSAEFEDAEGWTCSGPRNDLICGEGSTSISSEPKILTVALMDLIPEQCLQ